MINKDEMMATIKLMKEVKESFTEQKKTEMVKEMEAIIAELENELKSENISEVPIPSAIDIEHHLVEISIAPLLEHGMCYSRNTE